MIRKIEQRPLYLGEYFKGQDYSSAKYSFFKIRMIAVTDHRYVPLVDILSLKEIHSGKTPLLLKRDIVDIYLEEEQKTIKAVP